MVFFMTDIMDTNNQFDTDWLDELDKAKPSQEAYDDIDGTSVQITLTPENKQTLSDVDDISVNTDIHTDADTKDTPGISTQQVIASQEQVSLLKEIYNHLSNEKKIDRSTAKYILDRDFTLTYSNENFYTTHPSTTCFKEALEDVKEELVKKEEETLKGALGLLDTILTDQKLEDRIGEVKNRVDQEFDILEKATIDLGEKEIVGMIIEDDLNTFIDYCQHNLQWVKTSMQGESDELDSVRAREIKTSTSRLFLSGTSNDRDYYKDILDKVITYAKETKDLLAKTPKYGEEALIHTAICLADIWDVIMLSMQSRKNALIGLR